MQKFNGKSCFAIVALVLTLFELVINTAIILKVPYTEIDWKAYMGEVEGFLGGERNYRNLQGCTGPLVYPAGFVYIYSVLYWLTDSGRDIQLAQYIFAALYLVSFGVVLWIMFWYFQEAVKKDYGFEFCLILPALSLSKRLHSIYVLRLFNDPVAMLFMYLAIVSLLHRRPWIASVLYSLALSVKMNILLFAPGFLLILIDQARGGVWDLVSFAFAMISIQIILGFPFISTYPWSYFERSFNFARVFEYQWTVNWRLISEDLFLSRGFAICLLVCSLITIVLFAEYRYSRNSNNTRGGIISAALSLMCGGGKWAEFGRFIGANSYGTGQQLKILFSCQLIGIAFSRSLHYQFYSWYCWTLPFLSWIAFNAFPRYIRLLAVYSFVFTVEYCWNVYPSTVFSSSLLHCCHFVLLAALWIFYYDRNSNKEEERGRKRKVK